MRPPQAESLPHINRQNVHISDQARSRRRITLRFTLLRFGRPQNSGRMYSRHEGLRPSHRALSRRDHRATDDRRVSRRGFEMFRGVVT